MYGFSCKFAWWGASHGDILELFHHCTLSFVQENQTCWLVLAETENTWNHFSQLSNCILCHICAQNFVHAILFNKQSSAHFPSDFRLILASSVACISYIMCMGLGIIALFSKCFWIFQHLFLTCSFLLLIYSVIFCWWIAWMLHPALFLQ